MQKEKNVWIDEENRVLAFQQIGNSKRISKEEGIFWDYVMRLILSGYRIM